MNKKNINKLIRLVAAFAVILILFTGMYTGWNAANPEKSCASCHEIHPSVGTWANSAHSEISCFKCHGTALENGWHSLTEKTQMVFTHMHKQPYPEDIHMSEDQLLATMEKCIQCHRDDYANWQAGGHSAT